MKYIESLDDENIKIFSNLRNKNLDKENIIIVESEKVVRKLLSTSLTIYKIFATPDFFNRNDLSSHKNIELYSAHIDLMKKIVGHEKHHGVFALAEKPKFSSLDGLDNKIIILNGLTSPENIGSIVRTAAAFNINSLIFDEKTASPFLRRCIRVSMGNVFQMKVHRCDNLISTLKELKSKDYHIYSAANEKEAITLNHHSFKNKSALIIGSEGHGINDIVKTESNTIIKIPINNNVAHLNAGHAAAILIYHLASDIV